MGVGELIVELRQHRLFRGLSSEQVRRIAAAGDTERYIANEEIVSEGSLGDSIYLILEGGANVTKEGTSKRALAQLGRGEFFGEMSLVEPAPRSASVVACEATRVFRLPNRAMRQIAEEDPLAMTALLVAIVRVLSSRLRAMNEMVSSIAQLSDYLRGSIV